eukprot:TRINITY_DN8300_c0_g1_i6.p1 TRINITY_DN8300_c0_g1~~TRINITY_DN8300_c0_g1_i6.p1  ORF type:complete len:246 (+),score=28.15 TRINITY_DN8300_c0_g1_i6:200-937(+)
MAIQREFAEKSLVDFSRANRVKESSRYNPVSDSLSDEATQHSHNFKHRPDSSIFLQEMRDDIICLKSRQDEINETLSKKLLANYEDGFSNDLRGMREELDELKAQMVRVRKSNEMVIYNQREMKCQSKRTNEILKRQLAEISIEIQEMSKEIVSNIKNHYRQLRNNTAVNSFFSETGSIRKLVGMENSFNKTLQSRHIMSKYKSCNDVLESDEIEGILNVQNSWEANSHHTISSCLLYTSDAADE